MNDNLEWLKSTYPETYKSFLDQQRNQLELFAEKHRNYGSENLTEGLTEHETLLGLFFRMNDKLNRYKNKVRNVGVESDEGLDDTLNDLSNYSNIAKIVISGKWGT